MSKFLGENGLKVLVDKINTTAFERWFNELQQYSALDSNGNLSDDEIANLSVYASSCTIFAFPSALSLQLQYWFPDEPIWSEVGGTVGAADTDTAKVLVRIFNQLLNDEEYKYTLFWGLPFRFAVKNDTMWHTLTAPYIEHEEITKQEVQDKFK